MAAEELDMNAQLGLEQQDIGSAATGPLATAAPAPQRPAQPTGGGSPGKRRINLANFVPVGLFAAGIGCVFLLSLRNGPQAASAEERTAEAQVEAALLQLGTIPIRRAKDDETSAIVDTFYYQASQRQIPLEQLPGNPFVRLQPKADPVDPTGADNAKDSADVLRRRVRAGALAAVRKLQLQSVLMRADGAMAMISGNPVVEGKTINGWTVTSIGAREVILSWKNLKHVLKMPR